MVSVVGSRQQGQSAAHISLIHGLSPGSVVNASPVRFQACSAHLTLCLAPRRLILQVSQACWCKVMKGDRAAFVHGMYAVVHSAGAHVGVMPDFLGELQPQRRHSLQILLHHDAEASHLHMSSWCKGYLHKPTPGFASGSSAACKTLSWRLMNGQVPRKFACFVSLTHCMC